MEINHLPLISLMVYTAHLDEVDHSAVAKEIKDFNNSNISAINNDPSLCSTHSGESRFPFDLPACSNLLTHIGSAVSQVAGKEMLMESMWTSTLNKNESVPFHSHKSNTHMFPMEYFSVAYYPKAPDRSADFIAIGPFCGILENNLNITPKTGMIIIFNSFIQHYTSRHEGDESRIVVSGNYIPKSPNMTRIPDWSAYD